MGEKIFLYGPQTSGKTTRILGMIKRDRGADVLMSGEDKARVSNGREVCDVTLRAPDKLNSSTLDQFKQQAIQQLPVKHVLIDGAQFLTPRQIIAISKIFTRIAPEVPIVFAGCRYYVANGKATDQEIPTSRFLMNWCDQTRPVNRKCDFCHRLATRLYVSGTKRLAGNKIVAMDPHLVCDYHYRKLVSK